MSDSKSAALGTTIKLNGSNYLLWSRAFLLFLGSQKKKTHVLSDPVASTDLKYDALEGYSDADYAGSKIDRKSTSGYCTYLGGNLITWRSKKQQTVARSSAEAEYRAMAHTATEMIGVKNLLGELGFTFNEPLPMHCDNQAAIYIANNPVFHERTKHIEVDCHFIRECVLNQTISTPFTSSSDQIADIFTKPLGGKRFSELCIKLDMINIYAPA